MAFWRQRQGENGPRECFQFSHYLGGERGKEVRVAVYPMETVQSARIAVPNRTKKRGRKKTQKNPVPREPTAPDSAVHPLPLTPASSLPLHSYTQWPPAPTADGTGPMDEIRLHEQRMAVERTRRAELRPVPPPVIDPRLLATPERGVQVTRPNFSQSNSGVTPGRRRVMEVMMTPRRRSNVHQPRSTPLAPVTPRATQANDSPQQTRSKRGPGRQGPRESTARRVASGGNEGPPTNLGLPTTPALRPRPRMRQTGASLPQNSDAFFIRNRRAH
jgi:hypothetical protein